MSDKRFPLIHNKFKFKNIDNTEFTACGDKYTADRIKAFKDALSSFQALRDYLSELPESTNKEGLDSFGREAFLRMLTEILDLQHSVIPFSFLSMGMAKVNDTTYETTYVAIDPESTDQIKKTNATDFDDDIGRELVAAMANILVDNCSNSPYSLFLIDIFGRNSGIHSNYVFLDNHHQTFAVFEPFGTCIPFHRNVLDAIQNLLPEYKPHNVPCICNTENGPQTASFYYAKSGEGWCASWTLLFMLMQMANPADIPSNMYADMGKVINTDNAEIMTFIRKFSYLLENMVPHIEHYGEIEVVLDDFKRCVANRGTYPSCSIQ
jgi:hypothetical protein